MLLPTENFSACTDGQKVLMQAAGEVGWGEVEHWMWPLFAESWQQWRQEVLNLAPVPFLAAAQRGDALPPATPLLYGLPEQIVPRPGFWPGPDSVRMCGFWLDTQASSLLWKIVSAGSAAERTDVLG